MEAVHTAEQYALTYTRSHRQLCAGNRAKGQQELNRTMDGNCSECDKCKRALLMVQSMLSIWTEGDQTGYRDADGWGP